MPTQHEILLDTLHERGEWYEALLVVALDQTHDLTQAMELADQAWQQQPTELEEVDLEEAGEGGTSGDTAHLNLQVHESTEPKEPPQKVDPQQLDAFADLWAGLHGPQALSALAQALQPDKANPDNEDSTNLKEGFYPLELYGEGSFAVGYSEALDLLESYGFAGQVSLLEADTPQPGQQGVSTNPQTKPVVKAPSAGAPLPQRQGVSQGDLGHAEHLGKIAQHTGFSGYMTDKMGRRYYFENGRRITKEEAEQKGLHRGKVKITGQRQPGAGGEYSEASQTAADDLITRIKQNDPTARHKKNLTALAWHLANLSPEQLNQLRNKHGVKTDPQVKEQVKGALQKSLDGDNSWIKDLPQAVPDAEAEKLRHPKGPTSEPEQSQQPENPPPTNQRGGQPGSQGGAGSLPTNDPGTTGGIGPTQPGIRTPLPLPEITPQGLSAALRQQGVEDQGKPDRLADLGGMRHHRQHNDQVLAAAKAGGTYIPPENLEHLTSGEDLGGGEHHVYLDSKNNRVFKVTDSSHFGSSDDVHGYLQRIEESNRLWPELGYQVHGITERPDGNAGVVTSMNFIEGHHPETQEEVDRWFQKNGWEEEQGDLGLVWRDPQTGTAIGDAHNENFIKTKDGGLVPIDVDVIPGQFVTTEPTPAQPRTADHARNLLTEAIDSSDKLSSDQKEEYHGALQQVLGKMPTGAHQRMSLGLTHASFHPTPESVLLATFEEVLNHPGITKEDLDKYNSLLEETEKINYRIIGSYLTNVGKVVLDGGDNSQGLEGKFGTKQLSPNHIYAHELGHAIDGPKHELSEHADWQEAWQIEINSGYRKEASLTDYATTKPSEGFAEFSRLLYASDVPLEQVEDEFPRASRFFQERGLWPTRTGEEGAKVEEVFDKYISLGERGQHLDAGKPVQFMRASEPTKPRSHAYLQALSDADKFGIKAMPTAADYATHPITPEHQQAVLSAVMAHTPDKYGAADLGKVYEEVNKTTPLTPEQFRGTVARLHHEGKLELQPHTRAMSEISNPEAAVGLSGEIMNYARPGQNRLQTSPTGMVGGTTTPPAEPPPAPPLTSPEPTPAPEPAPTPAPTSPAGSSPVDHHHSVLTRMHEEAGRGELNFERLKTQLQAAAKMSTNEVKDLAQRLGIKVLPASKKGMLEKIESKIGERQASWERTRFRS